MACHCSRRACEVELHGTTTRHVCSLGLGLDQSRLSGLGGLGVLVPLVDLVKIDHPMFGVWGQLPCTRMLASSMVGHE